MSTLTLRGVTKRFGAPTVIHGVDIDIADGEFVALVGPSGCGKSTLLRMIAGLEPISGGEIAIGGRVVNDLPPKARDIAMVFQNYALYPHMTVRQNMAFSMRLRRAPKAEIEQRVSDAARILGLEALLDRQPRQLSGGQRQRVAMGRAIVRDPKVFLFDEPLSNLDAKLRVQMRAEIRLLHRRLNTTTVYVTHDQVEAMTMADKIVVLRDGRVEQSGAPLDLYDAPANRFVAGFIGSPAMNFLPGVLQPGGILAAGVHLPLDRVPAAAAGVAAVYGIRPEHVAIDPTGLDPTGIDPTGIEAEVTGVEPTGAETLLVTRLGNQDFICLVHDRVQVRPGDRIRLRPDPAKAHVFAASAAGERLPPG